MRSCLPRLPAEEEEEGLDYSFLPSTGSQSRWREKMQRQDSQSRPRGMGPWPGLQNGFGGCQRGGE